LHASAAVVLAAVRTASLHRAASSRSCRKPAILRCISVVPLPREPAGSPRSRVRRDGHAHRPRRGAAAGISPVV